MDIRENPLTKLPPQRIVSLLSQLRVQENWGLLVDYAEYLMENMKEMALDPDFETEPGKPMTDNQRRDLMLRIKIWKTVVALPEVIIAQLSPEVLRESSDPYLDIDNDYIQPI